jgi:broad specificity phosphatase PhoE
MGSQKMTTLVYLARHGSTVLNDSNRFRGSANPPLDSKGFRDAAELAKFFAPIKLSAIFYSDRLRSTQTAEEVAKSKPDVPCVGTSSLWAWDVGFLSGKEKNAENTAKLEEYINDPSRAIPEGESLNAFKKRIRPCLYESMETANRAGAPVLLVVHSSVIHEAGDMLNGHPASALVLPGGVTEICAVNGRAVARPVFKTDHERLNTSNQADTVS